MSISLRTFLIPLAAALIMASPAMAAGVGDSGAGVGLDPSGVGMGLGNNINVQTNVDASRDISVNKTFNGVNVGYGLAGATVLNRINDAGSYAQGMSDQRHAAANQAAATAAYAAQLGRALMAQ
jgi:hypothetical protein